MLSKPTPQQLTALANVAAQPLWKSVEAMLNEELAKTYERLVDAPKAETGKLQGRAKFLTEFIALAHKSPTTI